MAQNFQTIENFVGYRTKPDNTNTAIRALVSGSRNVLINDDEKVATRGGYTLDGSADTSGNPIETSFDWTTSSPDIERNLRAHDDELEYRYVASDGTVTWRRLEDSWTSVDFSYTTFWDTTELIDLLLFVNGTDKIYEWSGAITTVDSVTTSTITKEGTTTWANERFLTSGTRKVVINDVEYTYTGGETTTTLTGVTPDPTGTASGAIAHQAIREYDNQPADGFSNDVVSTLNNQLFVGSYSSQLVYCSAVDNFQDYTQSTPREPGEGAEFRMDSTTTALVPQEELMYHSGGDRDWATLGFAEITVGSTLTETIVVEKLKTGTGQAAFSRDMVDKAKNVAVFFSKEKTFDELGRLEDLEKPQTRNISDLIKLDFEAGTFTNGQVKYHKNKAYIVGDERVVYIYDIANGWWQPPQDLPVKRLAVIGGELYGHSADNAETFKLFTGTDDNGEGFVSRASLAYRNYGERSRLKHQTQWFTEGYISGNTQLTARYLYELNGGKQEIEKDIDGGDSTILFGSVGDSNSLGEQPLGDAPLGSELEEGGLSKFRIIHKLKPTDFFEIGVEYESDGVDQQWELLSTGGNVTMSANEPTKIIK